MPRITLFFNNIKYEYDVPDGTRLFDFLVSSGALSDSVCGGKGICKKCAIPAAGSLSPASDDEIKALGKQYNEGLRLTCMTYILGDATVRINSDFSSQNSVINCTELINEGHFGIAADIGTTTVAVSLFSLQSGHAVASLTRANVQRFSGADVISRINYCSEKGGLKRLSSAICSQLNEMISTLCQSAKTDINNISDCVIAGNTVMLHILSGLNPQSIGVSPFTPQSLFGLMYRGEQLGLDIPCDIFLPPCVSSYIGADITAGIIAAGLDKSCETENTLYIDIGTNGEIVLASGGKLYCCSAAAGPAFEGAGIKFGMPATNGAINSFRLIKCSDGEFKPEYTVTGGSKPLGICGSGIIDAVYALLSAGVIDESGYLEDDFYIDGQSGIYITPSDIRAVQLAKSAIRSGIMRLLLSADLETADLSKIILTGSFGGGISPESAAGTGIIPQGCAKICECLPNCALAGASQILLSDECRERVERLPYICEYTELSGDAEFNELFIQNISFEV